MDDLYIFMDKSSEMSINTFSNLFNTHPPVEDRIKELSSMI